MPPNTEVVWLVTPSLAEEGAPQSDWVLLSWVGLPVNASASRIRTALEGWFGLPAGTLDTYVLSDLGFGRLMNNIDRERVLRPPTLSLEACRNDIDPRETRRATP